MSSINTKKQKTTLLAVKVIVSVFFMFVVFMLLPVTRAHAALATEPVWQVLGSGSGTGSAVQSIWKSLLNVVNSLVVLVLIIIAFAEMLRINVNTYGIKKILPTLILAIIAANFSYIFCRLIIDVANVSLTFINTIGNVKGVSTINLVPAFSWLPPDKSPWYAQIFSGVIIQNLLVLVLAVLLLCLAFLFLVRNWVIYVLVIASPAAFMAMVLPQTKKYFTQWWTMLIQWAFMPLVSFVLIALGNKFFSILAPTSSFDVMASVIVGFFYYYAITLPFKLGGGIMQNFYKLSGAKWGVGQTKKMVTDEATNAWDQVKARGAQTKAGFLFGTIGKNREYRLKQTAEDLSAAYDQSVGNYVEKRRQQIARRQEHRKTMQGSTAWQEKKGLGEISTEGNQYYDETMARRAKSNRFITEMEAAEKLYQILDNRAKTAILSPSGDKAEIERLTEEYKRPGMSPEELKEAEERAKTQAYVNKMERLGFSEADALTTRAMTYEFGRIMARGESETMNLAKAQSGLLKFGIKEMYGLDKLTVDKQENQDLLNLIGTWLKTSNSEDVRNSAAQTLLNTHGINVEDYDRHGMIHMVTQLKLDGKSIQASIDEVTSKYRDMDYTEIPIHIRPQFVHNDATGKNDFVGLAGDLIARGQIRKKINEYTAEDMKDFMTRFSSDQIFDSWRTGTLPGEYTNRPDLIQKVFAQRTFEVTNPGDQYLLSKIYAGIYGQARGVHERYLPTDLTMQRTVKDLVGGFSENTAMLKKMLTDVTRQLGGRLTDINGNIVQQRELQRIMQQGTARETAGLLLNAFNSRQNDRSVGGTGDHDRTMREAQMRAIGVAVRERTLEIK